MLIKKESAELTFVYQVGGCGKTYNNNKRRDTPHLDSMGIGTQNAYSLIAIQGRVLFAVLLLSKTSTFPTSDNTKTLS